ncbi:hypothetical protein [Streptomyces sp. NPDC059949]|uniref:hypothetical protein n=1 Tax=Streptomyces sp. NPDC059949 TaxID=3347013 RepID=UPI0036648979
MAPTQSHSTRSAPDGRMLIGQLAAAVHRVPRTGEGERCRHTGSAETSVSVENVRAAVVNGGGLVARGGGKRPRKRELRTLAAPFIVPAPAGARIRDRLRLSTSEGEVLRVVGEHLGRHARADLAERVRIGMVPTKQNRRAERKRALTRMSSSRWAGAISRASEDQYQLSLRCLFDERASLRRAAVKICKRLAVPCGQRVDGVRGYPNQAERAQKQCRLRVLTARLAEVERRIKAGHPAIVVGGRRLAKVRHNLADAGLTETVWRERWDTARMFLTADGESGAPYGNYTISVDPADGTVTIVLPEPLRHLANTPRGRYRLACTVTFNHRREEWLDRVTASRAVRYDIVCDPERGRWYLDASWSTPTSPPPTLSELIARGVRLLAVDLNADHLAACVVDVHGNPVGEPVTVPTGLTGSASRRDGLLWGGRHWQTPLQRQSKTIVTRHHGAAVAIGRRALGHGIRRRPGVTAHDQRIVTRGATGQTVPRPRARGATSPPRTTGTPHPGSKTCRDPSDQRVLLPVSQDRPGRQPAGPVCSDAAKPRPHP